MKVRHFEPMTVAAHRGDCHNYRENTTSAFESALKVGAHMIETDVHLSKDGVLVLIHDGAVDRTTDGHGNVADMTAEELLKLNAGDSLSPEPIPLFVPFMEWAAKNDMPVNIEIKEYYSAENAERCVKCIEDVLACVEKYNMADKILINSFDAWVLEYVYKKYGKKYMLHGFYPYNIMRNVDINPDEYLYCACIFDVENKANFDYLIERNIEPWVGASVYEPETFKMCLEYGAKLITTNFVEDTFEKLKGLGK